MSVKNGKSVDLYEPTKEGYIFGSWNIRSDGLGKSYDDSDSIKVKEDINLYAQWTEDVAIYVDGITVNGSSNVAINKTTVMTADVSPSDATSTSVTWSVSDGTGKATIDSNGVLTGVSNGSVTVKATAKDGSKVSGTKVVTVSATEIIVPVSQISVSSKTGVSAITANGGTLPMKATVLPDEATNKDVTWSIENVSGSATIDSTGIVTASSNGTVTIKATAKDGSGKVGSTTISISGQLLKIPVDSIAVSGKDGATSIGADGIPLQMYASILPITASNKAVTWTVDDTTKATISTTGLLTPVANGTVIVTATAKDGSGKVGHATIGISNQSIKVTGITVNGADISIDGGTATMSVDVLPTNATSEIVTWSVENKTGSATINSAGVLTAISNGTVTVKATAADGSKVFGIKDIALTGQTKAIPVSSIVVSGTNNVSSITTDDGTLQMIATVLPTSTTSQAVTWSVSSGSGTATISDTGMLKAVTNGTVTVNAKATDGSKIIGTKTISLSGQIVQVDSIEVTSANNIVQIETDGTIQMSAYVLPANATKKSVTWSAESVTGSTGGTAIISANGVLTGKSAGDVNVIATATDGTGITGSKKITIIPQVKVKEIIVTGFNGTDPSQEIIVDKGSLQMQETITPSNSTNKGVTWSVEKVGDTGTIMTGSATISSTGILTAVSNGTVKVKATAKDGSGIVGSEVIDISNQIVKATGFTVTGVLPVDGITPSSTIIENGGTLSMKAAIMPTNATATPAVTWSVQTVLDTGKGMTGKATIDSTTGTLTAMWNGTVKVIATATDGSGIVGSEVITISNQIVKVEAIVVTSSSDTMIAGKTLQMIANISPTTATNKLVTWSVTDFLGTGASTHAAIDTNGKLTAVTAGTVTVTATSNDGSLKSGTVNITITTV